MRIPQVSWGHRNIRHLIIRCNLINAQGLFFPYCHSCNHLLMSYVIMAYFSAWPCLNTQCSQSNPAVYCGQPRLVCSELFPPIWVNGSYTCALLVAWITSICSGNHRQLLHVKGVRTTEHHIRIDLKLDVKGSVLSARSAEHVQTDLLKCKMVQWFKARVGLFSLSLSLFH